MFTNFILASFASLRYNIEEVNEMPNEIIKKYVETFNARLTRDIKRMMWIVITPTDTKEYKTIGEMAQAMLQELEQVQR